MPQNDYGVDLRVEIVRDGLVMGRQLIVQLKASANAPLGDVVRIRLSVRTYNYLRDRLEVALLVKYVGAEREAYWVLLKDVPDPPQGQDTVTVLIPRAHRLSANPWPDIEAHVEGVQRRKLGAARRYKLGKQPKPKARPT